MSGRRLAPAIVIESHLPGGVAYRILEGAFAGIRFAVTDRYRAHVGRETVVIFHPEDQYATQACRYCVAGCPNSYEVDDRGRCAACHDTQVHPKGDDPDSDLDDGELL